MKCAICNDIFRKGETSTIRNSWKGWGRIPKNAIVHATCDEKERSDLIRQTLRKIEIEFFLNNDNEYQYRINVNGKPLFTGESSRSSILTYLDAIRELIWRSPSLHLKCEEPFAVFDSLAANRSMTKKEHEIINGIINNTHFGS